MGVAVERDDHVLRLAIAVQTRRLGQGIPRAHGDHEILLVEGAGMKARRDVVGGDDGDVQRARLQLGESRAPGAVG